VFSFFLFKVFFIGNSYWDFGFDYFVFKFQKPFFKNLYITKLTLN